MRVYCKNAYLGNDTRIYTLLEEIKDIQWDIICFSEARAPDGDIILTGGHRLITTLGEDIHAGVGILIHASLSACVLDIGTISSRVMFVDMKFNSSVKVDGPMRGESNFIEGRSIIFRFVSVYMPHGGYPLADFETCLQSIDDTIHSGQSRGRKCIIGGDFNLTMGRGPRSEALLALMGQYGLDNARSKEFGVPDEDLENHWTFCGSNGRRRILDYILYDNSLCLYSASATNDLDLGSDHRALGAHFRIQAGKRMRKKGTISSKKVNWSEYGAAMSTVAKTYDSLDDLEAQMVQTAMKCRIGPQQKQGRSEQLRELLYKRRCTHDVNERSRLSKEISKTARKELRQYRNGLIGAQLQEWKDLGKLHEHARAPTIKKTSRGPDFDAVANLLKTVYRSDIGSQLEDTFTPIDSCTVGEVLRTLKSMKKKKCSDRSDVLIEMLIYGGANVHSELVRFFNIVIDTGVVPPGWRESFFVLLHKGGPVQDANNWRPIAILKIVYKVFARLLHSRIKHQLEAAQSDEQFGFRPGRCTTDALLIAETVVAHSIRYNFQLFMVSIDLRKAFDRVEQDRLFTALEQQGISSGYRYLLQQIYKGQQGVLSEEISFDITRGVRQGDVLSPLLFNAVLEAAISDWKARVGTCGFYIQPDKQGDTLSNIRFADDLLVFGTTLEEATFMLESLADCFAHYGLELNTKKTKIFSSATCDDTVETVSTKAGIVEILPAGSTHKYLGRMWPGNLTERGHTAVSNRIGCSWGKFSELGHTLKNRYINIKQRLKLFDTCISPALLYSLDTCPLTGADFERIDATQRKMLRHIVGWVPFANDSESWEDRGHRMKMKMTKVLGLYPITAWSTRIKERKLKLKERLLDPNVSPLLRNVLNWHPPDCVVYDTERNQYHKAKQSAGHPRTTWDTF